MKTSWFYKFIPQHKNQPCKFCPHKIGKTLLSAFDKLNYCWECDYRQLLVCHCYEAARSTSTELICNFFALCTVHFSMRIKQYSIRIQYSFIGVQFLKKKQPKNVKLFIKNLKLHLSLVEKHQCFHYSDIWPERLISRPISNSYVAKPTRFIFFLSYCPNE